VQADNPLPLRHGEQRQDSSLDGQAFSGLCHRPFHTTDTLDLLKEAIATREELRWCAARRSFVETARTSPSTATPQPPRPLVTFELALPPVDWPGNDVNTPSECTPAATLQRMEERRAAAEWSDDALDWVPRLRRTLVVLLSAEASALGLWEEGVLVRHKVTTAYTTRKVQGKSQLTHERGKSGGGRRSAGGALRARETTRLFDTTCRRLSEVRAGSACWHASAKGLFLMGWRCGRVAQWAPLIRKCDVLYGGGTVRVWNELWDARTNPLVDRVRALGLGLGFDASAAARGLRDWAFLVALDGLLPLGGVREF